jgi:cytochrome d ubiquinol oxidase subunit II
MIDADVLRTLFMAGTVALAVGVYVVLDGFDLGLGILFCLTRGDSERDQIMNSITPFWDGNETWLVLGGAVLIAMFPMAFSVIMPAVYLPVIIMLLALIFRGVAFEFRFEQFPRRRLWDIAFFGGSILATFAQGLVLGTFLQGIHVIDGRYAGSSTDWLTPFSILTGLALVIGYALLGGAWLYWRVSGPLQRRAQLWIPKLLAGLLTGIAAVSVWTPLMSPWIAARWFDFPDALAFVPVPLLTLLFAWGIIRVLRTGRPSAWPFAYSIGLFFLSYTGMAISIFPMLPPPSVSLFSAAASPESQRFLLPGIAIFVPVILVRTWLNYRIFRDPAEPEEASAHD